MQQLGISKLDLKRQNRMHILKLIKHSGSISRIDIADKLELTRAAVTIISNEMIEQGILIEVGENQLFDKPLRGRKKVLLNINHNYKLAFGVTIEQHRISVGLSTLNGMILDRYQTEISKNSIKEDIIKYIINTISNIMEYNCLDDTRILGIGIAVVPDMYKLLDVKCENGVIDFCSLKDIIYTSFKFPVIVDCFIKGLAMANLDFGQRMKDEHLQNIGFLCVEDNFNYTVINIIKPIYSYENRTDFINNLIVNTNPNFTPSGNIIKGSVRAELTSEALIDKIAKVFSKDKTPSLYKELNGNIKNITISSIKNAFLARDEAIIDFYNERNKLLAILINNLVFSTNPDKIVLHGTKLTQTNFIDLKDELENRCGQAVSQKIFMNFIEDNSYFLGGSALAIREFFYQKIDFEKK